MEDILIVSDNSLAHNALEAALKNVHSPAG